jgi:hypothetical protein
MNWVCKFIWFRFYLALLLKWVCELLSFLVLAFVLFVFRILQDHFYLHLELFHIDEALVDPTQVENVFLPFVYYARTSTMGTIRLRVSTTSFAPQPASTSLGSCWRVLFAFLAHLFLWVTGCFQLVLRMPKAWFDLHVLLCLLLSILDVDKGVSSGKGQNCL